NFLAAARLDESDADCSQQGRSSSWPGGADYLGNSEHGKKRSLLCRREDRTLANFFLGSDELVAGRDNKHMDFRLSVMKVDDGAGPSVVVSTLCMVHNQFGQHYLSAIIPVHKFGVRRLMANALAAHRL